MSPEKLLKLSVTVVTFTALLALVPPSGHAQGIKVVATDSNVYALARQIATSDFEISLLCPSTLNPHSLPMRPSFIQQVREANLLITVGLDHEPWLFDVLTAAGNRRVMPGLTGSGYVDTSRGVALLQVPAGGGGDRSAGDIHVFGNTHYWLHPKNARIMAFHIMKALAGAAPGKASEIQDRTRALLTDLDRRIEGWKARLAPLRGVKIASYHVTWTYLEDFVGLHNVGTVEPRPGIPETPGHIASLTATMKREQVPLLLMAPWYNRNTGRSIAAETGAKLVVLPPSTPDGSTYADHFESLVDGLTGAFAEASTRAAGGD